MRDSAPSARPPGAGPPAGPGRLIIVSAPSGAGKSTLCRRLLARLPQLVYSISYTTRRPRAGERDGVDYHFISQTEFRQRIAAGRWAEWAEVHGNYYGTAREDIARHLAAGRDVLLDIDVQGMRQLLQVFPRSETVFIRPPSLEVLRQRLERRGTESPEVIDTRMRAAEREMAEQHRYRHVVVNDRIDAAEAQLLAIVAGAAR